MWRKTVAQISDRAKRYRARRCIMPGAKLCVFCGSTRNLDAHHINGDESDSSPANLCWACRSCNTRIANVMRRAGLGRRTRQFNPTGTGAKSLGQWLTAVLSMKGEADAMSVRAAVAMIRATPPERRSEFAQEIWRRRRQHGTGKREEPPF